MKDACLLIGDIGGTNARFALGATEKPGFSDVRSFSCDAFPDSHAAIRAYLESVGRTEPDAICLAAAGPVVGGRVTFTNNHWGLDEEGLRGAFSTDRVKVLNDFEAVAYCVPFLTDDECLQVGATAAKELQRGDVSVGVVGPGTGLGTGGLLRRNGELYPIVGEGGHVGFAPASDEEALLLQILQGRFGRVSVERIVSGPGLENVDWALAQRNGEAYERRPAAEIFAAAERGERRAAGAVRIFFDVLGHVAGDLALALGAADGLYLAGGILKRYPQMLADSGFRAAFESKGRHRSLMEAIPTELIVQAEPGLLGASYRALRLYAG
ncbi:MAG: glucokinase [Pseudomonadota bacterium]